MAEPDFLSQTAEPKMLMPNIRALLDEISDWDLQDFPLAGVDVLSMLVKHGLATKEEALAAYEQARAKHEGVVGSEVRYVDEDKLPF